LTSTLSPSLITNPGSEVEQLALPNLPALRSIDGQNAPTGANGPAGTVCAP
jgi:hypothetical protein